MIFFFTGKWDTLDPVAPDPPSFTYNASDDSFDSFDAADNNRDYNESERKRLREIEIKTVQYQDELESGQRPIKTGWTMQQQIEHFRRKLLKKSNRVTADSSPTVSARRELANAKRSPSPLATYDLNKKSKRSHRSRSSSNSARSRSRSRSTSPYSAKLSKRSPHSKRGNRDSITPEKNRSAKRQRSASRDNYSLSPKRHGKERHNSPSPVRVSTKYDSPPRRHR